jgi:glycosyltransferase involved in cell wall biosynthesis
MILTGQGKRAIEANGQTPLPATYFSLAETGQPLLGGQFARNASILERRLTAPVARMLGPVLRFGRDVLELTLRRRAVRRYAEEIIERKRPDGVLVTSDDGIFLIGAYQAAREMHLPICVLFLDIYARNNYSLLKRLVARFYEPRIVRCATKIFVTNPQAQSHYRSLYGIEPIVLEHSSPPPPPPPPHPQRPKGERMVAYTGSVYWAQADAMRNLVDALLTVPEATLELVTEQNESDLARMQLVRGRVHVRRCTPDETTELQTSADILFLPLSFGNEAPDLIRTSAPGKMAEYLVSGVPVLVHAPADSYISRDAGTLGWGLVVDRPDVHALAEGIRALLTDRALRDRLVSNALRVAASRHNEAELAERFRHELESAFG